MTSVKRTMWAIRAWQVIFLLVAASGTLFLMLNGTVALVIIGTGLLGFFTLVAIVAYNKPRQRR